MATHEDLVTQLIDAIQAGARWLSEAVLPDGRFCYIYYPETDTCDVEKYNEVRHAGATYSLFQAVELTRETAQISAAERAVEYMLKQFTSVSKESAAYAFQGRMKLGGQALAIVALLERRRVLCDASLDNELLRLGRMLLDLERPVGDGSYYQSFLIDEFTKLTIPESRYYPGEALLALSRLASHFGYEEFGEAAVRACNYLLRVRDGDMVSDRSVKTIDHWMTIALCDSYRLVADPTYVDAALLQRDAALGWSPNDGVPQAGVQKSFLTKAELLVAVWALLAETPSSPEIAQSRTAAIAEVYSRIGAQIRQESAIGFPNPAKVLGSWIQSTGVPSIRIDFVQHNVSALVGTYHILVSGHQPKISTTS